MSNSNVDIDKILDETLALFTNNLKDTESNLGKEYAMIILDTSAKVTAHMLKEYEKQRLSNQD